MRRRLRAQILVNLLRIFIRTQARAHVQRGGAASGYAKAHDIEQVSTFGQFERHRANHAVTRADGTHLFHRRRHHLKRSRASTASAP